MARERISLETAAANGNVRAIAYKASADGRFYSGLRRIRILYPNIDTATANYTRFYHERRRERDNRNAGQEAATSEDFRRLIHQREERFGEPLSAQMLLEVFPSQHNRFVKFFRDVDGWPTE